MSNHNPNNRPLSTLYGLMMVEFLAKKHCNKPNGYSGICFITNRLCECGVITNPERYELKNHLLSQRPTEKLHSEFYHHPNYTSRGAWWWVDTLTLSTNQRIKFIGKMIEITQDGK
jgi:hypothetical protein